jgi:hypothetical protein
MELPNRLFLKQHCSLLQDLKLYLLRLNKEVGSLSLMLILFHLLLHQSLLHSNDPRRSRGARSVLARRRTPA